LTPSGSAHLGQRAEERPTVSCPPRARKVIEMSHWLRWSILSVFAALMAVSPVLAANEPAPDSKGPALTLPTPAAVQLPARQPVTTAAADRSTLQLKPVLTARVPFETAWNTTVLSANSQAMGLQSSRAGGTSKPIRWAIAGAAVGAIVGAVAGDPLTDAAIGGVVGFGAAYVMHR